MRILLHMCCGPCAIAVLEALQEEGHETTGFFYNPNIHPLAEYMRRREGAVQTAALYSVPLVLADTLPHKEQTLALFPEGFDLHTGSVVQGRAAQASEQTLGAEGCTPAVSVNSAAECLTRKELPENLPYADGAQAAGQPPVLGETQAGWPPRQPLPPAVNPILWLQAVHGHEKERCLFCWFSRMECTARYASQHGFDAIATSLFYSRHQNQEMVQRMAALAAERYGVQVMYRDDRKLWQHGVDLSKKHGIYRQQYCGCVFSEYERYAKQFITEKL